MTRAANLSKIVTDANLEGTLDVTGVLTGTSLDISGNIDVDGITNLDVVDIDGAVDMASTLGVTGVVTANAGVVVDNITIDGTEIDLSSGDLTVDVAGDITLDAGGGQIRFFDDGTEIGVFSNVSSDFLIVSAVQDKDILFNGNDGGAAITALTLDMSDGGTASFRNHITLNDGSIAKLGNASDLQIYHDGSNSYIDETGTGDLYIRANPSVYIQKYTGENMIVCSVDGSVHLYHNNFDRLQTSANGIEVLNTTSGEEALVRIKASTSGNSAIAFGDTGNVNVGKIDYNHADNSFAFDTNSAERVRISSDGVTSFATTNTNPAENNVAGTSIMATGAISASADGNFGLQVNRKSSFGGVIHLRKDGSGKGFIAIFEDSSSGRLLLGNDNTCLLFNDSTKQIIPFQSTGAKQDDIISLGNASGRFDQVFAANGSINTSDRNEKQDIEELTDAEKRVAVVAKGLMRKYRWKSKVALKGDKARTHFGIIAQDLQDAFTAESLDASDYAMFCSDTYWDNDEVYVDDDGVSHNVVKSYYTEEEAPDGATKKTRLGVRYSELLAFIISAI